ncbi:MAG: iron-containing alcohol dehydrogenase [Firmicutes bacterium]|nr:iron-containing alcohol dehydrogenase [Bacillota bacterium]
MINYTYYNPTRIYFGDKQLANLPEEVKKYGDKVLLLYGGGSVKKNGVFDEVEGVLKAAGIQVFECGGVEPNPLYTSVNRAAKVCRENDCDVVVALGGGSVIDAAKVVTKAKFYEGDSWDLITKSVEEERGIPLIAIPTIASAGAENDAWAVISNPETQEKLDPWDVKYQPTVTFINPAFTKSVPDYQIAVGAADILSHITDIRYFINEHKIAVVNEMMEAMARNIIKYAPIAMQDPEDEEARMNMSWIAAMITGGVMDQGGMTDMVLHMAEYGIAAFYEIPHGHGIGIMMPRWMQYVLNEKTAPMFYRFGVECLEVEAGLPAMDGAQKTIDALSDWLFNKLGLESHLAAMGVEEKMLHAMAVKATERCGGKLHSITDLSVEDIENIYRACL